MGKEKIGVFLCDCRDTLSNTINFDALSKSLSGRENVSFVVVNGCLCDQRGLELIKGTIGKSDGVKRIIIGACTPRSVTDALREAVKDAGIDPYFLGIVGLREWCAWVHDNLKLATEKARLLILGEIAKMERQEPVTSKNLKISPIKPSEKVDRRGFMRLLAERLVEYRVTPSIERDACLGPKGCRLCLGICPFDALFIEDKAMSLDKDRCEGCGICVPICPVGAIEFPTYTDDQVVAQITELASPKGTLSPRVLAFLCGEVSKSLEAVGEKKLRYPPNVLPIVVPCAGMVSTPMILYALERGADGVVVASCPHGKCPYKIGDARAKEVASYAKAVLECFGIDVDRVKAIDISENTLEEFAHQMVCFIEDIRSLKSHPFPRGEPASVVKGGLQQLASLLETFSKESPSKAAEIEAPYFGWVDIDSKKCTLCEICSNSCPTEALKVSKVKSEIELALLHSLCINCKICENRCPEGAIKVRGIVKFSELGRAAYLLTGELAVCPQCGSAFASQQMMQKIRDTIRSHGLKVPDEMKLCQQCRAKVIIMKDILGK